MAKCLRKPSVISSPLRMCSVIWCAVYPNANDAAFWQYHVGESYFAAQQFETAIQEYEKVRQVNKNHKSAPESLYAISTCAQLLSEAAVEAGDTEAEQHWYDRLFAANEALAAEYPESTHTADATYQHR